jgi:hypothetical protein
MHGKGKLSAKFTSAQQGAQNGPKNMGFKSFFVYSTKHYNHLSGGLFLAHLAERYA